MASAGQFVVQDDGTIGLSSGGASKVFTTGGACDECCTEETCPGGYNNCGDCVDGQMPTLADVTFSDVVMCYETCSAGIIYTWVYGTALNATHRLTNAGDDTCYLEVTYANAIRIDIYNEADCVTLNSTSTIDVTITLRLNVGVWELNITTADGGIIFRDFQAATAVDTLYICNEFPAFTNDYAAVDCGLSAGAGKFQDGYEGSATVVCA